MKRAILYIRVSTDEQADKGFSLASQEEYLRKYCQVNQIEILHLFKEDYSAKTFERPEFRKMMLFCKKNRSVIDDLLFVKWDRFSRNTRDSYHMIHEFQNLNIEVRAIEQPLDLTVPESKLMLAIYLASPEVENDRRSLNVISGMRKAKKEGRYMGIAPLGYKNSRDEFNKPVIKPDKNAHAIALAFEELSTGNFTQEEVRQRLNSRGVICSRNNFNKIVRNPMYVGRLFIPPFKDEKGFYVDAIHEPIVAEGVFCKVQEVISSNTPLNTTKNTAREEFPLRGFLKCGRCGRNLTGSSGLSKHKRKYYYYHCTQGCKEIFSAKQVHNAFEILLSSIVAKKEVMDLYEEILRRIFGRTQHERVDKMKRIDQEVEKNTSRISKATQMMLDAEIDMSEYRAIKSEYEEKNKTLLLQRASLDLEKVDYKKSVHGTFNLLRDLDKFYNSARVEVKQKLLGLMFTEKLIFQKDGFQTPKMNEVLSLIMMNDNNLETQKKGLKKNFILQSPKVSLQGFKPRVF